MGLIRKVKCVIVEGDNIVLKYKKKYQEWDLPGQEINDIDDIIRAAKKSGEKQLGADLYLEEFLGSTEYDHDGDLHRTFFFKARVKSVNEDKKSVRLISLHNLDKPTLNQSFAESIPLLKKKLLFA